jgi:2-succinyl-6-hydroxy-2,4-cyclohexadiene-1-carboxylate synthase
MNPIRKFLSVETPCGRIKISYLINQQKNESLPLILLHGFTGSSNDWIFLFSHLNDRSVIAIDLPGHGASESPAERKCYSHETIALVIKEIVSSLGITKVIILGYSMGGRAALSFANKYPRLTAGLILESTSFGIKKETERKERVANDEKLARLLTEKGIQYFVDYWLSLPMFHSLKNLPPDKFKKMKEERLKNSIKGLANSLLGFSTGKMPFWGNNSESFSFPVYCITGKLDNKFTNQCASIRQATEHVTVQGAGHNVHLEKPQEFITFVIKFLERIERNPNGI